MTKPLPTIIVVHRELGPGFEHTTDTTKCPCEPYLIYPDDPRTPAELASAVQAHHRRQ